MSADFSAVSLNVQGIRNKIKKTKDIKILQKIQADVILLQETHSQPQDEKLWKKNGVVT